MAQKVRDWDNYNIGWWKERVREPWDMHRFYISLEAWQKDRIAFLKTFCKKSERLIDIGCGPWELLYIKNDRNSVGLDISKAALLNLKKLGFIGDLVLADCRYLPFIDKAFSHSICSEVIEHMASHEDVAKLAGEVKRISKNAIITTPNSNYKLKIRDPTHFFFFTPKNLKHTLSDFEIYRSNIPPTNILLKYIPYDSPRLQRFLLWHLITKIFQKIDRSKFMSFISTKLWGGAHLVAVRIEGESQLNHIKC